MKIKAVVMDVDGTLTDGGIYLDSNGNEMKKFNVKDGYAINTLLQKYNIIPIIITGRKSEIVTRRCTELGIDYVVQGSKDKAYDMRVILNKLSIKMENIVYIGDDLNDLECMKLAVVCACPNDATEEIKSICDFVSTKRGGHGAVREIVEKIVNGDIKK